MHTYKRYDPKGWCGDPTRGAALGRNQIDEPNDETFDEPMILKRVPLNRGGYDPNGTYYGTGTPLYWLASSDGNIDRTFRAEDDREALDHAAELYPEAKLPTQIEGLPVEVGDVELDEFAQGYVECALWLLHNDDGEPVDEDYDVEDIDTETLLEMKRECADFQEANKEGLNSAYDTPWYDAAKAGHDFWLTRNHHGAGFWDRGLGEVGRKLTEAAHVYGDYDLYVGDDGKVRAG